MNKLLMILALVIPSHINAQPTQLGEDICLSRIMFSESQGEPITGVIAIGEATVNRSRLIKVPICNLSGVTSKPIVRSISMYYATLAKSILNNKGKFSIGNADSWNTGNTPKFKGDIVRKIAKHTFYKMDGEII